MKKLFIRGLLFGLILLPLAACMTVKQQRAEADIAGQSSQRQNHATHERVMANGMQVIVREDHRAPVVVSQIWYKIGSGYEPSGITGISHVLEHMMFKGTKKHGPGEFSRIIAAQGGSDRCPGQSRPRSQCGG